MHGKAAFDYHLHIQQFQKDLGGGGSFFLHFYYRRCTGKNPTKIEAGPGNPQRSAILDAVDCVLASYTHSTASAKSTTNPRATSLFSHHEGRRSNQIGELISMIFEPTCKVSGPFRETWNVSKIEQKRLPREMALAFRLAISL